MNINLIISALSPILFGIGLGLIFIKKNLIMKLIGVEFMLNAGLINLIFINQYFPENLNGQSFTLFVLAITASEIAVALSIIIQLTKISKEKS